MRYVHYITIKQHFVVSYLCTKRFIQVWIFFYEYSFPRQNNDSCSFKSQNKIRKIRDLCFEKETNFSNFWYWIFKLKVPIPQMHDPQCRLTVKFFLCPAFRYTWKMTESDITKLKTNCISMTTKKLYSYIYIRISINTWLYSNLTLVECTAFLLTIGIHTLVAYFLKKIFSLK